MRNAHVLLTIVLCCVSLSSTSCGGGGGGGGDGDDCADCGPCGFVGGPTGQMGMRYVDVGRDESGNPAVDVIFHSIENPSCDIHDEAGVVYDPASGAATFVSDGRVVVSDEQEYSSNGVYHWSEEGVQLTAREESDTRVSLLFIESEDELTVECTVDANEQITCD